MRWKLKIAGQVWKDSGLRLYVKLLKTTKSEVGNLLFIRHWLGWEITRWLGLKVCPKSFLSRKWSLHPLHGVHHEAASPNHRHLVQDLHAVPALVFVLELKPATKWHKWTFLGGAEVVFFTSMLGGRVLIPPRPVRTANTVFQIWVIWVFLLKKFPDSKISSPSFQVLPSYFPNPMARKHWWDRSFRSFGFWANRCENYDCLSVPQSFDHAREATKKNWSNLEISPK